MSRVRTPDRVVKFQFRVNAGLGLLFFHLDGVHKQDRQLTVMDSGRTLRKRFLELQQQSISDNCYYFTDFLAPIDISSAYEVCDPKRIGVWGGSDSSERRMIRFGNPDEMGYEVPFPIVCMKISPVNWRFSALMHLGVQRDVLGDIICHDGSAYVFVVERMAQFVEDNLFRVKHTDVSCTRLDELPVEAAPVLTPHTIVVSSARLDGIISKLFHLSRSEAKAAFERQEVFCNGRVAANPAAEPREDDVISLRHYGKCVYRGIERTTKKGNISVKIDKYD